MTGPNWRRIIAYGLLHTVDYGPMSQDHSFDPGGPTTRDMSAETGIADAQAFSFRSYPSGLNLRGLRAQAVVDGQHVRNMVGHSLHRDRMVDMVRSRC